MHGNPKALPTSNQVALLKFNLRVTGEQLRDLNALSEFARERIERVATEVMLSIDSAGDRVGEFSADDLANDLRVFTDELNEQGEHLLSRLMDTQEMANDCAKLLNCTDPHPGQLETDIRRTVAKAYSFGELLREKTIPPIKGEEAEDCYIDHDTISTTAEELISLSVRLNHVALNDTATESGQNEGQDIYKPARWFTSAAPKDTFNAATLQTASGPNRNKIRKRKVEGQNPTYSVSDALAYMAWSDYHDCWRRKLQSESKQESQQRQTDRANPKNG